MMTMKDLWQIPITKHFTVVAGKNALCKKIESVEILDFEFATGIEHARETIFNPNSLVLSSLLFANQHPELLLETIKKLIELRVSALAYKPVIFKELPDEIIAYANEKGFPILRFGGDEFFETVIMEVMEHIKERKHETFLTEMVHSFLEEEVTEEQIHSYVQQMNRPLDKYICVANLQRKNLSDDKWMDSFLKLGIVCHYRNSLFLIYSDKHQHIQFEKALTDHMDFYHIPSEEWTIGYSETHVSHTGLHLAVREAYYSCALAMIEMKSVCHYEQLTSERILFEFYRNDPPFARNYMNKYLHKLLKNQELLHTAISFILKNGNVKEVAGALFCHSNTIRYRLSKIQQMIDPSSNELAFYEHLSQAVKLYLLDQQVGRMSNDLDSVQK
ncbi:PucR family transcriptional regulator [Pseudogracilibacillus auburnensis]|uniref:CdaR family transcriptional regulator n=1 Tax=Pseudogracilibacillus auburnensis TaxID=1494959 RepID=A0A2V3VVG1_9BACI|nr:PucR family transcriptional regulator [Pseudogracilibacillus auburnensis]PXW84791.1 CdaR family transcriptional regulator [Pseudogracilibacillus auburnensis]